MADTALTIITDALLDIGVLADGETPSASQAAGALRKLNNMLDAWNLENLMVYGATPVTIPLSSGKGVYTIGPGGDIDMTRPTTIESIYIRDTNLPAANRADYPIYLYTNEEWQQQAFKSWTGQWPNYGAWINWTYPLIQIYTNPIPSTGQYSLIVWIPGYLSNLALATPISLSPGYKRAITANLCIELAGSYQVEVPGTVAKIAEDSKYDIKIKNLQLNELSVPGTGQYDIVTNRVIYR